MKYLIITAFLLLFYSGSECLATTYYVRSDGGPNGICDGKTDAPAPNIDGHCAWNHPFEALPPGESSRIAGGDTLIIKNGSYRMGHTPGLYDSGKCNPLWPWDCYMAEVPSGPDADNPTRILGEEWDTGCSNPPELWGTEASNRIVNLDQTSNIDIQCLNITDHAECSNNHGGSQPTIYKCLKNSAPTGDWASSGFYIKDSTNGLMRNVKVHGLSSFGVKTGALTDWTFDKVDLIGNGYGGFSNDLYGAKSTANSCFGNITFSNGKIRWSGCVEKYPDDGQPHQCYDQNQGGYGDALGSDYTVGTWTFDNMDISFNSSDGIDLLYHRFDLLPDKPQGNIIVKNSYFEGNVGNSIKTRGNAVILNNALIGNCDFFNPDTSPYTIPPQDNGTKLMTCRGNATSTHSIHHGADLIVANNSYTGQSDIILNISGKDMQTGGETAIVVNNIFHGGPHFLTEGKLVDGIFAEWQVSPSFKPIASNNLFYSSKGEPSVCVDESISSLCGQHPLFIAADFDLEVYDFELQENSPAIAAGLPSGSYLGTVSGLQVYVPTTDINKKIRGQNVTIGAYESVTQPAPVPSEITILKITQKK